MAITIGQRLGGSSLVGDGDKPTARNLRAMPSVAGRGMDRENNRPAILGRVAVGMVGDGGGRRRAYFSGAHFFDVFVSALRRINNSS